MQYPRCGFTRVTESPPSCYCPHCFSCSQIAVTAFWYASTCQLMLGFLSIKIPKFFSSGVLLIRSFYSLCLYLGVLQIRSRAFNLSLLCLMRFAYAHVSILSRSLLCMASFSTQLSAVSKHTEDTLNCTDHVTEKDV